MNIGNNIAPINEDELKALRFQNGTLKNRKDHCFFINK